MYACTNLCVCIYMCVCMQDDSVCSDLHLPKCAEDRVLSQERGRQGVLSLSLSLVLGFGFWVLGFGLWALDMCICTCIQM